MLYYPFLFMTANFIYLYKYYKYVKYCKLIKFYNEN